MDNAFKKLKIDIEKNEILLPDNTSNVYTDNWVELSLKDIVEVLNALLADVTISNVALVLDAKKYNLEDVGTISKLEWLNNNQDKFNKPVLLYIKGINSIDNFEEQIVNLWIVKHLRETKLSVLWESSGNTIVDRAIKNLIPNCVIHFNNDKEFLDNLDKKLSEIVFFFDNNEVLLPVVKTSQGKIAVIPEFTMEWMDND